MIGRFSLLLTIFLVGCALSVVNAQGQATTLGKAVVRRAAR